MIRSERVYGVKKIAKPAPERSAMRTLANENIPGPVVRELRKLGHDVVWAWETLRGEADHVILSLAQSDERLVVTPCRRHVLTPGE